MGLLVGIDQGTSGTTVQVLDHELEVRARASQPLSSHHTEDGGVEQDPWAVLASVVDACAEAMDEVALPVDCAGFSHQGETVMAWDAADLEPLTPAMVWSDRRSAVVTAQLTAQGKAELVHQLSGMRLDPYFCAAKYRWMLDNCHGMTEVANASHLRLGTLESWLLLKLGASFQTDIGTASRTQLTHLGGTEWNSQLLDIFGVSEEMLAPIGPSIGELGVLAHPDWTFSLPLTAVLVDQAAALAGNGCLHRGDIKATYGTGAFVVANAGKEPPQPQRQIIPSVAWGDPTEVTFVLDGGVLSVGSALTWLSKLGIDVTPSAHDRLIDRTPSSLVVRPAFNGTGAPHWDRNATASIAGITASTSGDDILHAFLDSFAYRVREIVGAMAIAGIPWPEVIHVDGGLTRSRYLMQRQADVLATPLAIATNDEGSAAGAAALGASAIGLLDLRALQRPPSRVVEPVETDLTEQAFQRWHASKV